MATPMLPHDLLEPCPPIFPSNTPIGVVIDGMVPQGTGCVLVMDAEVLVGIFTAWDLARWLTSPASDRTKSALMQVPLMEYMSQPVVTIPDSQLNDGEGIRAIFAKTGVRHLPVVDGTGYPVGMVSWARVMATSAGSPLSDLQRMEQQLKQIFDMGHDLRSPLNVILGLTQLMTSSPEISPAQKVNLETISNSGYQLLKLINQVLSLTQMDNRFVLGADSNGAAATAASTGQPISNSVSNSVELPKLPSRRVIGLAPNQPSYRVLIVDDQPANCCLLRAFLSVLKVDVKEANDGKEAIACWQTWHPHLIWMDVQMPVMNGYEATQAIRQLEHAQTATPTKIIALTASAHKDEDELAKAAGCDDFVRKPFAAELFFDKMALHLGWQYCYQGDNAETPGTPGTTHGSATVTTEASNHPTAAPPAAALQPTDFQIMSAAWIEKIHRAALGCDDYQIKQLLTEIPDTHGDLRQKLDLLIHNYQFDQIIYSVRAIQTSAGNAKSEGTN